MAGGFIVKNSFIYPVLFCTALTVLTGQEKKLKPAEVPATIRTAVSKRFPNTKVSNWSKETEDGKTTYEATISGASGKRDVVYAEDASFVALEEKISVSDVPTAVKEAIAGKYPNATLRAAEKISHDSGDPDYELDLDKAAHKEVTVSSGGKILKEE